MINMAAALPGVLFLALVVFAIPLAAHAQPAAKLPRIGVLWQTAPPPPVHPSMTALLQGLKELGWEDGKSVAIEYRYGANQADRLAAFAAELVGLKAWSWCRRCSSVTGLPS